MLKFLTLIAAGLAVAGVAAAQDRPVDRAPAVPEGSERFWVQERPLSTLVSTDTLAQDRRFAGTMGYGINLAPPMPARGPLALDTGAGQSGQLSLDNWHFGVDVLQSAGGLGRPTSIAQFAMNYGGQVADSLTLSVGPTVSLGGGDGTASLFGGAGGLAGRRLHYDAGVGVRDYGLRGAAVYSLTDSWALTGVLGYRRSIGELGATATDEQFFSVFGLGYRF
jgi:hypothetical protein